MQNLYHHVNQLIYGVIVGIQYRNIRSNQAIIFLCPNESRMMQIVDLTNKATFLVDLTEIIEFQNGEQNTLKVKNVKGQFLEIKCLDYMMVESMEIGLEYLVEQAKTIQRRLDNINQVWSNALKLIVKSDFDMDLSISLEEFQFMLGELQLNLSERKMVKLFESYQQDNQIQEAQLYKLIMEYNRKDELLPLYHKYCTRKDNLFDDPYQGRFMTDEDLKNFFLLEQGQDFEPTQKLYNFYEFCNTLFSLANQIFLKQPVNEFSPICNYLISSSHNTYLEANQLTGGSSPQAYIDAFKLGAKCVELDCWDGEHNEPVVTHGHTLVNNILFYDVIKTVRDYGFVVDDYPVILSFEMHCKPNQQKRIAQILDEILGEMLFKIDDFDRPELPLLSEMKRKVIVKNKGDPKYMEELSKSPVRLQQSQSSENIEITEQEEYSSIGHFGQTLDQKQIEKEEKVSRDLMRVTSLFAIPLELDPPRRSVWTISSVEEGKIKKIVEKQRAQVFEFVKKYFLRVYPLGLRFDSSNYDPMPSWCAGAQMVALNTQTRDLWMLINQGRFLNSTYVLKETTPYSLRLTIKIISASNLIWEEDQRRQQEVVDPYVKVRIAGNQEDEKAAQKWRTKTIDDNGYHPVFDYECQIQLRYAHQAVIYFQAYSYSMLGDTLLGQFSLPVTHLRRGYRVVPLLNSQFQPILNSYILTHIRMEEI